MSDLKLEICWIHFYLVNSILYQGHFRGYISNNHSMTSLQNLYESEQWFYERVETFQMLCMKGYIYLA